jgi:hypothetical protein
MPFSVPINGRSDGFHGKMINHSGGVTELDKGPAIMLTNPWLNSLDNGSSNKQAKLISKIYILSTINQPFFSSNNGIIQLQVQETS